MFTVAEKYDEWVTKNAVAAVEALPASTAHFPIASIHVAIAWGITNETFQRAISAPVIQNARWLTIYTGRDQLIEMNADIKRWVYYEPTMIRLGSCGPLRILHILDNGFKQSDFWCFARSLLKVFGFYEF